MLPSISSSESTATRSPGDRHGKVGTSCGGSLLGKRCELVWLALGCVQGLSRTYLVVSSSPCPSFVLAYLSLVSYSTPPPPHTHTYTHTPPLQVVAERRQRDIELGVADANWGREGFADDSDGNSVESDGSESEARVASANNQEYTEEEKNGLLSSRRGGSARKEVPTLADSAASKEQRRSDVSRAAADAIRGALRRAMLCCRPCCSCVVS